MTKLSFEQSFQRLEKILEQMNAQDVALEDSLKLYEEANTLIIRCTQQLSQAEKRIEMLNKNRQGQLQMSDDGLPSTTQIEE